MYDLSIAKSTYFIATFKKEVTLCSLNIFIYNLLIVITILCQSYMNVSLQNTLYFSDSQLWYSRHNKITNELTVCPDLILLSLF